MKISQYAMTASMAAILAGTAGAASAAPIEGGPHVARWVAKAIRIGPADDAQVVRLKAFLGFRDHQALRQLIRRQSTPGSPDYHHYLTAAEFHQRFAPSAEDAARVENGLRAAGFTVTGRPPSNLFVDFTGTVAEVKAAFKVSQDLYAFAGKTMRANAEEPSLPASLAGLVQGIVGLDDSGQLIHPFHHSINDDAPPRAVAAKAASSAANPSPAVGPPVAANAPSPYCSKYFGDTVATLSTTPSPYAAQMPWVPCGYTPQQMRVAYGADKVALDGTGVTVAIVDAYVSPTLLADANRYAERHKLPKFTEGANLQIQYGGNIKTVSASDPCDPQGWFTETSLDVDAVHAMAPGADILYAGALSCSDADLDGALYTVIDGTASRRGPLASIVSNSYGNYGEPESSFAESVDTAIFEQAASEGVTLLFSSGDDGDVAQYRDAKAEASWPASNVLVTAVGGTSLALLGPAGRKNEWGWGTFRAYLSDATVNSSSSVTTDGVGSFVFYIGAGGGPSFVEPEPDYQTSVVPPSLTDVTYGYPDGTAYPLGGQFRVTPDVAMDADPYTGFLYGETLLIAGNPVSDAGCKPINATSEYCEESIGGTSVASPLFAGTLALVAQARQANGYGPLGLATGRFYQLPVGQKGSTTTPLIDVKPPATPTAVLRGYVSDPNTVRVAAMNSTPGPWGPLCKTSYCNGQDSWILKTKPNYDDVTGVGVPYIPALVSALSATP